MSTDVRRIGKYELHKRLGRGHTAEVWKAFDSRLSRPVTIKFFHARQQQDPELQKRFVDQEEALAALHHPHIPQLYETHVAIHMNGAILSPRSTSDQRKLALQISTALNEVKQELEQVRQDAKQFVTMTNAQLLAPSSLPLVEDILKQAQYAYTGQSSPSTKSAQGGALWIYDHLQRLTTFEVKTYVPIT